MKKLILLIASLSLATCSNEEVFAQTNTLANYPSVSSVTGSDQFPDYQGVTATTNSGTLLKASASQLSDFIIGPGAIYTATGKTLTLDNTLTFTGTDSSSVNFGAGGTVLYASTIGSTVQAYSTNLALLSSLASSSNAYVLAWSTTSNSYYWTPQTGAAGITIGSNGSGVLTYSSSVLNLANPVNLAGGLVQLDVNGNIPPGEMGNYIGASGGVQGYSGGTLSIATGKTLASSNTLTFAGTDGSTLNIGAGGTLGSAAFLPSSAFLGATNNLSDLASASAARSNLGLGTLSTSNSITTSNINGLGANVAGALAGTVNAVGGVSSPLLGTYYVNAYSNGTPNTKILYDAVYTSGSNTLTSGSATFTSNDIGKDIVLCTSSTARQITTIASVISSNSITLSTNALSTRAVPQITGATDASPIVFTSAAHGLSVGEIINVSGVGGNTAANGIWSVATVPTTNTFTCYQLTTTTVVNGNGTYTSGGTVDLPNVPVYYGTSNTSAIQSAITAAYNAGGGLVKLDAGIYMVPDSPSTTSNSNNSIFYIGQNQTTPISIAINGNGIPVLGAWNGADAASGSILYLGG